MKPTLAFTANTQTSAVVQRAAPVRPHLVLTGVTKRYGSATPVVTDLDLAVQPGELLGILGPSGCGKSTTMRMIAGLVPVSAGRIEIGGQDVTKLPAYERDIGLVFQSYALFPHMTVGQNVAFGLEMRKLTRSEIDRRVGTALELVRLSHLAARRPRELSGGQQQRVALARALVIEPRLLLLDEPLSNLDAKLRDQMRIEIREIQRTLGITTLFVTHDQVEALSICDRIALLESGSIAQLGTPHELYERPRSPFVAEFVGRINKLPATVREGGLVTSSGVHIRSNAAPAVGRSAVVMIRPHRIRIRALSVAASAMSHANLVQATVQRTTFVGELVQYEADAGGTRMQVEQPTAAGSVHFRPGDRVELSWSVEDTLVFEDPQ